MGVVLREGSQHKKLHQLIWYSKTGIECLKTFTFAVTNGEIFRTDCNDESANLGTVVGPQGPDGQGCQITATETGADISCSGVTVPILDGIDGADGSNGVDGADGVNCEVAALLLVIVSRVASTQCHSLTESMETTDPLIVTMGLMKCLVRVVRYLRNCYHERSALQILLERRQISS